MTATARDVARSRRPSARGSGGELALDALLAVDVAAQGPGILGRAPGA